MNVTSPSHNFRGLTDWFIQRLSALVLLLFVGCLVGFYIYNPDLNYVMWSKYFSSVEMKIFTFVATLSLVGHTWVGMWTVFTDYIKPAFLRLFLQTLLLVALLALTLWVALILLVL